MAGMGAKISVGLVVILVVFGVSVQAGCPNYRVNNGCNTGSCKYGGLVGNFSVPGTPFPCGFGTCSYSGTILIDGQKVTLSPRDSAEKCCQACKSSSKCNVWQWLKTAGGGECFLYPSTLGPSCGATYSTNVGSKCGTVKDDPHFVGAHGTHYDFNGEPGKSFCLVSDLRLHMNMKMTGYLDERTESASLLVGGKAVRTWIRELGLLWMADGSEHSLLLAARSGKETARGDGFLALAQADGEILPRMDVGDQANMAGGLTIKFLAIEKSGIFDLDVYNIRIENVIDMTIQLRVAHPLLQRPDDAEAHISLAINWMESTPAIHGVLGQTYRDGRDDRTTEFTQLSETLHRAISAEGETGKGFLDGRPSDYVSSDVLRADCRYSGFNGRNMPTTAE